MSLRGHVMTRGRPSRQQRARACELKEKLAQSKKVFRNEEVSKSDVFRENQTR